MMGLWHVVLLFAVSLLHSCITQGPSTRTVFVQAGKDLFLEVNAPVAPQEGSDFIWKLNGSLNIVKISGGKLRTHTNYEGRVSIQNYSLLLKDAQQSDSGDYKAFASGDEDQTIVEYKVTVQYPVSRVELTAVSRISDSCNLTVTCSSQEFHIISTVRCDNQICSQEGGERSEVTTSGTSLNVYLVNTSIICNHSNQVSWTKEMKKTEDLCTQHDVSHNGVWITVIVVIVTVMLIIMLVAGYLRNRGKEIASEVSQMDATTQPPNQSQASDLSPTSTYCLVGPHTRSVASTGTRGNTPAESVYAQVEKPARP